MSASEAVSLQPSVKADRPIVSATADAPPDWILKNIADASQNTAQIYFVYVGALAYCALTVVTASDQSLVLNEAVRLPIVGLDVPFAGFFALCPILLILLFVYLQIYISRVKTLTSDLRARGMAIEKGRLYPWLLNIADDPDPAPIGSLQSLVAEVSVWWLLPAVLVLFAIKVIKKHDPALSYVVNLSPLIAGAVAWWFWSHYPRSRPERARLGVRRTLLIVPAAALLAFSGLSIGYVIPRANKGVPPEFLKKWTCVDLSFRLLVNEPKSTDYAAIHWADLRGVHLEGAELSSSVLKRADLRSAHLEHASLVSVNLERADLAGAYLEGANLSGANLTGALLTEARLESTTLSNATLLNANLESADLKAAKLTGANLHCANLASADLQGATLAGSNMMQVDVWRTQGLSMAQLLTVRSIYRPLVPTAVLAQTKALNEVLFDEPQLDVADESSLFDVLNCTWRHVQVPQVPQPPQP